MRLQSFGLLVVTSALLFGCNLSRSGESEQKDLLVDGDAKNIALLVSSYNEGEDDLWWSKNSIKQLRTSLRKIKGTGALQVRERHDVTAEQLVALTTKAAKDVGPDGTLVWYVASHGWTDGFATAGGGRLRPADIVAALRAGRSTPIRRLILLFDYCGSGGMVEGLSLQGLEKPTETLRGPTPLRDLSSGAPADPLSDAFAKALQEAGMTALALDEDGDDVAPFPLYQTALYFAPTTKLQTTEGSTFTEAMAGVVKANVEQPGFKIRDFLNATVAKIAETTTHEYPNETEETIDVPQQAVYRALPSDAFLDETLFSSGELGQ